MKLFYTLLVRFIIAVLAATALLALIFFMVTVGRVGLDTVRSESMVGLYALHSIYRGVLPAVILGALYVLFCALHLLERTPLPLVPVCACAAVLLYAIATAGSLLPYNDFELGRLHVLRPESGMVYRASGVGNRALIPGNVDGLILENVVLHSPGSQSPEWQKFSQLLMDPADNSVVIPGDADFPLYAAPTAKWSLFRPPRQLQALADELSDIQIALFHSGWLARGVIAVVMSIFLFSVWVLVRLTRWPLINAIVVMGAVRMVMWCSSIILQAESAAFMEIVLGSVQPWLLSTLVYGVAAGVLLIGGVLQSPFRTWSEEVR